MDQTNIVILLLKAYPMLMNRLMHDYQPPQKTPKLNRSQWKTLFIIHNMEKPNMSQVSRMVNMEKGSLTSVVDGLIEKGLVHRVQDESDRRKILLELPKESETIVERGMIAIYRHIMAKLAEIEASHTDQLVDALKTITSIAEKL